MKQPLHLITAGFFAVTLLVGAGCAKKGCTDKLAHNYDSEAEEDDESCEFLGEMVFWCDSTRTRKLVDNGVFTPVSIKVNDSLVGKLNYYNYLESKPGCEDDFSNSVYEEVLNYTHTMSSKSETADVKIEDANGNQVIVYEVTVELDECTPTRI